MSEGRPDRDSRFLRARWAALRASLRSDERVCCPACGNFTLIATVNNHPVTKRCRRCGQTWQIDDDASGTGEARTTLPTG